MATHAGCNYCRLGKHSQTPLCMHLRSVCLPTRSMRASRSSQQTVLFAACELANTKTRYLWIECVWALLDFLLCWAHANTRWVVNFESSSFHTAFWIWNYTREVRPPVLMENVCSAEQRRHDLLLQSMPLTVKCKYVRAERCICHFAMKWNPLGLNEHWTLDGYILCWYIILAAREPFI